MRKRMTTKADAARANGRRGGRPPRNGAIDETRSLLPDDNPHRLKPRELLFVKAYCGAAHFVAAKAYALAGYAPNRHNAGRLLAKEHIQAAIAQELTEQHLPPLVMSKEEALGVISNAARGNIGDVLRALNEHDPLLKLPADVLARVKAVRPTKFGRSIELHDKVHAAELLGKHHGAFVERHEHEHKFTYEELLTESRETETPPAA